MQRSTKLLLATVAAIVVVAGTFILSNAVSEWRAVSSVLQADADASIWLASAPNTGHHDDPRLWNPVSGYDDPIVGLTLTTDAGVAAFASNASYYPELRRTMLGEGVSDAGLESFLASLQSHAIALDYLDCYASLSSQDSIDAILSGDLKCILLASPEIYPCDLSQLSKATRLEELWLHAAYVNNSPSQETATEGRALQSQRYPASQLAHLRSAPALRVLYISGADLTQAMVAEIGAATQLTRVHLSRCRISDDAISELEASMPNAHVKISSRVGDDGQVIEE